MSELRKCPFCGGDAAFGTTKYCAETVREQGWNQDVFHSVNCIMCGASNRGLAGFETPEKAAEHWNKRDREAEG